jgi:hypothetical protein
MPSSELVRGRIAREMGQRESMLWAHLGVRLAVGIPLTLLPPIAVALFLKIWLWLADVGFNYFSLWLLLAGGAWFYLARRMVKQTDGRSIFAEEVISEIGQDLTLPTSLAEWESKQGKATAHNYVELLFHGPREVWEAWALIREWRDFPPADRQRAVEVIEHLAKEDKGIPWTDLRKEGEDIHDLLKVLGYLKLSEWLGMSSDGKKVWLLSPVQKKLNE